MTGKSFANFWAIVFFVCMLAATPIQAASAQDAPPAGSIPQGPTPPVLVPQEASSLDLGIRPVEVRLNPVTSDFRQAPPAPRSAAFAQQPDMLAATFTIQYVPNGVKNHWNDTCTTFPDEAKLAFNYAAGIWASQLNSTVPIKIEACWSDMAAGVLGHAGAVTYGINFANAPHTNTWYPIALANLYSGVDQNGTGSEISIAYNSDFLTSFYYGTDNLTPADKINFATVVLHEIAHGLGFSGLMNYSGGVGTWGGGTPYPAPYDRFSVDASGNQLINPAYYANASTQLGTALVSNNVYFNGANARAANGGSNAKLYAPNPWKPGSSYAHLDHTTYFGTPNGLMTYSVSYGVTNHNPGPVTMGILTDIGWPYPPTDITLSNASVTAGQPAGTTVGALSSTDPNTPEVFTYALVAGGADNASFSISGSSLQTSSVFPGAGTKSIRVRSTDRNGLSYDKNFTITVTSSVNNPPTNITLSASSVAENGAANTTVGALSTTDPDAGNTFTYNLVSAGSCLGTDNSSFNISGNSLRTSASFDYELKSSYNICIRTTDQGALTFDKPFTITVTNVNEPPTGISLSASSISENVAGNTTVGTLSTIDPDAGSTFTYSLVSTGACLGTDNAAFNLAGSSVRISSSPDYEFKSSYAICVRSTDQGSLFFDKAFTITITNLNEPPTDIALSATSIAENQPANTLIGTLSTTDPDAGGTFTYMLVSSPACPGTDNAAFNISGSSLRAASPLNYESKTSYNICIRTTDQGSLFFNKAFTITVTDVNEPPTGINLSATSIAENQPASTTVGTLSSTDPDAGNTFTYALVSTGACPGTDNAAFDISGSSLRAAASFDYEIKSSYAICVRTTDQNGLSFDQAFTITVTNVNEAPTNLTLSANTIAENQPPGTPIGTLSTTDPDAGGSFTYTLVSTPACPGTDNSAFNTSGSSLHASASFNFESKTSYAVCVRSTDQGSLAVDRSFTITITDVNEAAGQIQLSASQVQAGASAGTEVGALTADDPDTGDVLAFTLTDGYADNAQFTITGSLLSMAQPVTKTQGETYAIQVAVEDEAGLGTLQTFTIQVVGNYYVFLPVLQR